jgi:RNA polymerase sigma factor (sigma-70 family)
MRRQTFIRRAAERIPHPYTSFFSAAGGHCPQRKLFRNLPSLGARAPVQNVSPLDHETRVPEVRGRLLGARCMKVLNTWAWATGDRCLETYVPGLRRYFAKRVPAAQIDDLIQEVFLRLQAHHGKAPIEHLDRYLFTVAASVLTDQARRRVVRHDSAHESFEERHHPVEERSPERVLSDREDLDMVMQAIDGLPPRTRDVFVLHRFEEMSGSSIAVALGLSISAVEKHIMRALQVLHERLKIG